MATKSELLVEAEAAYHRLLIGEAVVEVRDQNGETIRYQASSAYRLAAYIQQLKNEIVSPGGPMRFVS